jgi:putative DNA primase/helicase
MYPSMSRRSKASEDRALAQTLASARLTRTVPRAPVQGTVPTLSAEQRAGLSEPGQRCFLAVPHSDIHKARALGAEWDSEQRVCWIPVSADSAPFAKWLLEGSALESVGLSESDVLNAFEDAMRDYGLIPERPKADGVWHNVATTQDKGKQQKGAYILNLSGVPSGYIRNFIGREGSWRYDGVKLSAEQRAALDARARDRAVAREREIEREHLAIAKKTERIFTDLPETDASQQGYLIRKKVGAYGVRVARIGEHDVPGLLNLDSFRGGKETLLIIPARDVDGKLWTVQAIPEKAAGQKLFASGARKKGTFHIIGADSVAALRACSAVLFVEGYATGASLFESTGLPVVVAFDASNLVEVAKQLRRLLHKAQPKIICGDNDQFFIEKALAKIETVMPRGLTRAVTVQVVAGNDGLLREVSLAGYQPDGLWRESAQGKYKLALESVQGIVRAVTVDVVSRTRAYPFRMSLRNKGLESAQEAARVIDGKTLLPSFESVTGTPTDFNDLANAEGRERVAAMVAAVLPFELPSPDAHS